MFRSTTQSKAIMFGATAVVALSLCCDIARADQAKFDKPSVTIGIHNGKPWGYLTPEGKPAGVNADIDQAIFGPLGIKTNFVTADFGSLIPGLISNRFDIIDSSVVITQERCKLVAFSNPELTSIDALLVKKGNPKNIHSYADVIKNPALKIGGSRGSQQAKNADISGVKADQLQLFQNTESTVSALMAGRVDGIVFTAGTVNALAANPEFASSVERAQPFSGPMDANGKPLVSYVAAVFRKQDTALRTMFDKRLAQLKADGTVARIMARYGFTPQEAAPAGLTSEDVCSGKS